MKASLSAVCVGRRSSGPTCSAKVSSYTAHHSRPSGGGGVPKQTHTRIRWRPCGITGEGVVPEVARQVVDLGLDLSEPGVGGVGDRGERRLELLERAADLPLDLQHEFLAVDRLHLVRGEDLLASS